MNKVKNFQDEDIFLERHVFVGLKNLNDGFDAASIQYFSEQDFEIVLQRVKKYGIMVYGIEPWKDGGFYDVKVASEYPGDHWYEAAFQYFKSKRKKLVYAATYCVPDELLVAAGSAV